MKFFVLAFLLSALCALVLSNQPCAVVINEVNFLNPENPEKKEFIELKATCGSSVPLRGYKLIGMDCKGKYGSVELVVTLWNEKTDKNGYYTIGGPEVSNANIRIPHDLIKFRRGFAGSSKSMSNFVTNGFRRLHAIILLHDSESLNPFDVFVLTKKNTYYIIGDRMLAILKQYTIDMVVYTEKAECDECEMVEIIHSEYAEKRYTLRETMTNLQRQDISLNRCTLESIGFVPEKFKIGTITPGSENDCNGLHFILEENIEKVISPVKMHADYQDDYDNTEGAHCSSMCTSSIEQSEYSQVSRLAIDNAMYLANEEIASNTCPNSMLDPKGPSTALEVTHENNRKRRIGETTDYSEDLEWETEKYFRCLHSSIHFFSIHIEI